MRKKSAATALVWALAAVSLTGCSNAETAAEKDISAVVSEETTETETQPEEETNPAPEEEASIEMPEEAAEDAEEVESEEEEPVSEEPVTDEWAVDLYHATLEDDYKTVTKLIVDIENIRERCAAYEDAGWALWDYETAYKLKMSDEQVMGIIVYEYEEGNWEIDVFVSYQEGDGFEYIGYGDHCVSLYGDGSYTYMKGGNEIITTNSGQTGLRLEEDEIFTVWHM